MNWVLRAPSLLEGKSSVVRGIERDAGRSAGFGHRARTVERGLVVELVGVVPKVTREASERAGLGAEGSEAEVLSAATIAAEEGAGQVDRGAGDRQREVPRVEVGGGKRGACRARDPEGEPAVCAQSESRLLYTSPSSRD